MPSADGRSHLSISFAQSPSSNQSQYSLMTCTGRTRVLEKLLGTLVSSLSDQRVLFLTASRPVADVTLDSGRTLRLMLPPLKEQEVAELLAGLCALPNAAWASWFPRALTDATHGVPLMILETLHLLVERGLLRREDNEWHLSDETALRDALHSGGALTHRVSLLTDSEKRHLRLLAVAGGPIDVSVLASADLRTTEESRSGLTNLETRGFVTRTGELWQIAHDEIARTIQDISTAEEVERAERIVGIRFGNPRETISPQSDAPRVISPEVAGSRHCDCIRAFHAAPSRGRRSPGLPRDSRGFSGRRPE
jgi:predicted ATPase